MAARLAGSASWTRRVGPAAPRRRRRASLRAETALRRPRQRAERSRLREARPRFAARSAERAQRASAESPRAVPPGCGGGYGAASGQPRSRHRARARPCVPSASAASRSSINRPSSASRMRNGSATSLTQRYASDGSGAGRLAARTAKRHHSTSSHQHASIVAWRSRATVGSAAFRPREPAPFRHVGGNTGPVEQAGGVVENARTGVRGGFCSEAKRREGRAGDRIEIVRRGRDPPARVRREGA